MSPHAYDPKRRRQPSRKRSDGKRAAEAGPRGLAAKVLLDWFTRPEPLSGVLGAEDGPLFAIRDEDRAMVQELVYGVVRHRGRLDVILRERLKDFDGTNPLVLMHLRIAVYQLSFLDNVPDYRVVDQAVRLCQAASGGGAGKLANGVLRAILRQMAKDGAPTSKLKDASELAAWYTLPGWLAARWWQRYGREDAIALAEWMAQRPESEGWLTSLPGGDIPEDVEISPNDRVAGAFTILSGKASLLRSEAWQAGAVHLQSAGSQLIARMAATLLEDANEPDILDLCAAPGGKTALVVRLRPDAEVTAVDMDAPRVRLLKDTLGRLRVAANIIQADGTAIGEAHPEKFDISLVDAPCSSTGVIRSTPEVRWNRREDDLAHYHETQFGLLQSAWQATKPKGVVVYSVCSLEPEETVDVVSRFNDLHQPEAVPLPAPFSKNFTEASDGQGRFVWPPATNLDGFFCVIFRKPAT